MERTYINEFHKQWIESTLKSIASWQKQPISLEEEKEAAGNVEPTEGYKRRQVEELKLFATQHDLWININSLPLSYLSKGGENEVFTGHEDVVFKLNNFEYAGEDIENFFS